MRQVSLYSHLLILQGIAAGIGFSNFVRAFCIVSLTSASAGSTKQVPRSLPALSSFGFSIAHFCSSFRCAASHMSFHISGHKWTGLDVVCFFVNRSPDHVHPFGGLSSNLVNRVNPVHESDRSRFPSIFQSSSRRSSITSKVVLVALVTSMYCSGIGNDSSLGTYSLTLGST